jgi:hypothetical protein
VSIVAGIESRVDVVESVAVIGLALFRSHPHLPSPSRRQRDLAEEGARAPRTGQELQEISRAGSMFGVDVTPAKRRERKR